MDFGYASEWQSRVTACPSDAPTNWFCTEIIGGTADLELMINWTL